MTEPKSFYDATLEALDKPFKARLEGLRGNLQGEALAKAEADIKVIEGFRGQLHKLFTNLAPAKDAINGVQENGFSRIAQDVFGPADKPRTAQEIVEHLKKEGLLEEVTQAGKTEKALQTSREWLQSQYEAHSGLVNDEGIKAKLKEASAKHVGELDGEITNLAKAAEVKQGWVEWLKERPGQIKTSFTHEFDETGKAIEGSELSAGKKFGIKGGVTAVGALMAGDGLRRMASKDENGDRHLLIGGIELGAGTGAAYWALTKKFVQKAAETAARTA